MSIKHQGQKSFWKGKKLSEEHKQKILKNHRDISGKNNMSYNKDLSGKNNSFYGKKHTIESKNKMRLSKKGIKLSKIHCNNISNALKGKKHSLSRQVNESKGQNTTGFFRVSCKKSLTTKQGFYYVYSWYQDGKRYSESSVDMKKLEKKVKDKNLPWFKLDDYNEV